MNCAFCFPNLRACLAAKHQKCLDGIPHTYVASAAALQEVDEILLRGKSSWLSNSHLQRLAELAFASLLSFHCSRPRGKTASSPALSDADRRRLIIQSAQDVILSTGHVDSPGSAPPETRHPALLAADTENECDRIQSNREVPLIREGRGPPEDGSNVWASAPVGGN
eukprot:GHVT01066483.1.p1 GENE.GHVT01066483.1~~GHVT01066483.1.p1  ORF type:complete len:167 (+),score=29.78 GHVT01066483.1:42-542(+)